MGKTNRSNQRASSVLADKAAAGIAEVLTKVQKSWATWMSNQAQKLSPRVIGLIMAMFFLLMASLSLSSILDGIGQSNTIRAEPAMITVPVIEKHHKQTMPPTLPQATYRRIHDFKKYLDSLASTNDGKKILDSLRQHRPGLLDSVTKVEQLYQSLNQ